MEFIEVSAKTVSEAITEACQKLGVTSDRLEYEVLEEGLPLHPLKEQRESVNNWRQIGLGVMGIADMLIHMGLRYGSKSAVNHCEFIAKLMA